MMTRARITEHSDTRVTIEDDDILTGERRMSTYRARPSGYVVIEQRDGSTRQVCTGLFSTGDTLMHVRRETLAALLRRERRAGIRRQLRAMER